MPTSEKTREVFDLLVIGGGINGCGIARDAAGRGMSVALAEMNDLASATSSASTKLFHGGLRYLEYFEINLVRHALDEREVLLRAMPHISWPMRFVLPYHKDMRFDADTPASRVLSVVMPWMKGRRPAWLIRLGLFAYDNLGGRKLLPATSSLDLRNSPEGAPLQDKFEHAFEYSDCWIEDARLVALNARDASDRGAHIMVRTKVVSTQRRRGHWDVSLVDALTGAQSTIRARMVVNAAGPWVGDVLQQKLRSNSPEGVRLVKGSHIVTRKLFDHDKCYFFQGTDGRIIFAIPYETDFTLIGTTDVEHDDLEQTPECTDAERDYLIHFANGYFERQIDVDDVVWTYSGVRPLYDDGASSATAATRDYTLTAVGEGGAPMLNVFGGKITTYRKLAEDAMDKIAVFFPGVSGHWTAGVPLPGGDFDVGGVDDLMQRLRAAFPFLTQVSVRRLIRAYGTDCWAMLNGAKTAADLGDDFGFGLSAREVGWLMDHEFAVTAEDVVWRRSKLGLRLSVEQIATLDRWMTARASRPVSGAPR